MIDIVVVAYRSGGHLRAAVEPLCGHDDIHVVVVDNACPDDSVRTVAGLQVEVVRMGRNAGFAAGCNAGATRGTGDTVLFLNPDATISADDARLLASYLESDPSCGAVAPRILHFTGQDDLSVRRAPRVRSAFGEALFLHHLVRSAWPTETVRAGYDRPAEVEWVTGAVLCVRRSAFEQVGGFDERFFLYSEDTDLCARLRRAGFVLRYEPAATARHQGGGSGPRPSLAALNVAGRITYARIHHRGLRYFAFRGAYVLHELLRLPLAATRSRAELGGRLRALQVALGASPRLPADHAPDQRRLHRPAQPAA